MRNFGKKDSTKSEDYVIEFSSITKILISVLYRRTFENFKFSWNGSTPFSDQIDMNESENGQFQTHFDKI